MNRSVRWRKPRVHIESQSERIDELERMVADHAQRFDTIQTPWWKRLWYRFDGWPGGSTT